MSCIVLKRILGYELCILEKEGTLYYNDNIVLIRKKGFIEIFNLDTLRHETGDRIPQKAAREAIYAFIKDHENVFRDALREA